MSDAEKSASASRGTSRVGRGGAGAAGARIGLARSTATATEGVTSPASSAGPRQRPTKASAALQRKQQLGRAPVGGGRQQQMATGFETVRLPTASLQRGLGDGVVQAQGERHAELSEVFAVLTAARVTGDELWQGAPVVRPLIKHYARDLRAYAPPPDAATLVSFVFPQNEEFAALGLVAPRAYRVERLMPISVLVQRVLTRLGVAQPERFTLATLGGFVLHEQHRLADYGLGSLLPNWELTFVDKSAAAAAAEAERAQAEASAAGSLRARSADPKAARVSLLILYEDQDAWPLRLQRLVIAPDVLIETILRALIERHAVPWTFEQLELRTFDDDVIDPSATLENYGLGHVMTRWAVKLQVEPAALEAHRQRAASTPAAAQSEPAPPAVEDAAQKPQETERDVAPDSSADDLLTALKLRNEELMEELARAHARETEQIEQHAKVMARAQKLREHLEQERLALRTQLEKEQQRAEDAEARARHEQAERTRSEERLQHRIDALEAQLSKERLASSAGASEEQQLLEASLSNLTAVVENLEIELAHANTRLSEQRSEAEAQAERAREKAAQQQAELERLSQELVRAQGEAEREAKARADAERRVAELEAKLSALEQRCAAIEESAARAPHSPLTAPKAAAAVEAPAVPVPPAPAEAAEAAAPAPPEAEEVLRQWVHEIVDKSSEAADPEGGYDDWAATQLIGPPKISAYGDSGYAWAPFETNGGHEWLTLRFRRRVKVHEILILESWNPGAITKVELMRPDGSFDEIWAHEPEPAPPELRILRVAPEKEPEYATNTIKIHLDTSTVGDNEWNEIAAVQLAGIPTEPEPVEDKTQAATPPPPPPPPMTLPTPPPPPKSKIGSTGKASASKTSALPSSGDLMTDLLSVVQSGKGGLRSVSARPTPKPKVEEPADTIAAVLLKRFNALHGAGKYEDLSGGDDWADEAAKAGDAEWGDDDDW